MAGQPPGPHRRTLSTASLSGLEPPCSGAAWGAAACGGGGERRAAVSLCGLQRGGRPCGRRRSGRQPAQGAQAGSCQAHARLPGRRGCRLLVALEPLHVGLEGVQVCSMPARAGEALLQAGGVGWGSAAQRGCTAGRPVAAGAAGARPGKAQGAPPRRAPPMFSGSALADTSRQCRWRVLRGQPGHQRSRGTPGDRGQAQARRAVCSHGRLRAALGAAAGRLLPQALRGPGESGHGRAEGVVSGSENPRAGGAWGARRGKRAAVERSSERREGGRSGDGAMSLGRDSSGGGAAGGSVVLQRPPAWAAGAFSSSRARSKAGGSRRATTPHSTRQLKHCSKQRPHSPTPRAPPGPRTAPRPLWWQRGSEWLSGDSHHQRAGAGPLLDGIAVSTSRSSRPAGLPGHGLSGASGPAIGAQRRAPPAPTIASRSAQA
jgi:hypothetical protein